MRVVGQRLDLGRRSGYLTDDGIKRSLAFLEEELVGQQLRAQGSLDAVQRVTVLLPGLHPLTVIIPELGRQLAHAGVQQVAVFEHLVVEVILRQQPESTGFDAHVDVLGNEDHRTIGIGALEVDDDRQNLVIDLGCRQPCREVTTDRFGLQEETAAGQFARRPVELDALIDALVDAGDDGIERCLLYTSRCV